jgi:DNA polymerase III gamma/tau subunit
MDMNIYKRKYKMSLHLAYRPKDFDEFAGNRTTIGKLQAQLKAGKLPHSLMFIGPSGCGKTTLARILKDQLGCSDLDFIEINAGNNRGIETGRQIIANIRLMPMEGDVRIYLLDEIHQGTKDFQNALLKPLEDTPSYVYFMLCTTDPQKLLKTIRNRCSTYEVGLLNFDPLMNLMERIVEDQNKEMDERALEEIYDVSEGCPRQALVILDQVINLDPRRQRRAVKAWLFETAQTIELCRALFGQQSWGSVKRILKQLDEDPEKVRRAVIGYMSAVAINDESPIKAKTAAGVFEAFRAPFYDTGKPGLVFACWNAVEGADFPH